VTYLNAVIANVIWGMSRQRAFFSIETLMLGLSILTFSTPRAGSIKSLLGQWKGDLGGMAKLRGFIRIGECPFGEAGVVWSVQTENP